MPVFLKTRRQLLRDFLVFDGNDARQHLKQRYFAAEAMEAGGELDSHRARAENRQRLGHVRQIQNLDVGEDALGVGLQARGACALPSRWPARCARVSRICAGPSPVTSTLAGAGQAAVALDPVDLVLLHQELDALGVLGDDLVLAVEHQGEIEARIIAMDAVFFRVLEALPDVGGVEESLGGDAAHVQAGSAQLGVFFDDGGFEAVLSRANGRRISTGAAPDDDHVVCHEVISFSVAFRGTRPHNGAAPV